MVISKRAPAAAASAPVLASASSVLIESILCRALALGSRMILPRIGGRRRSRFARVPSWWRRCVSGAVCGLDQLDQPVALAQRRPVFVAEVVSCLHGRFGQRAIGEPCEVLDQLVILEVRRLSDQSRRPSSCSTQVRSGQRAAEPAQAFGCGLGSGSIETGRVAVSSCGRPGLR